MICSDLPFVGNGDAVVEIIDGTGTEKVIVLSLNSGNVAPYYWRYTYWVISGTPHSSGWIGFENTNNKVISISSASTNEQYPSAKCVYDIVGNIQTLLAQI